MKYFFGKYSIYTHTARHTKMPDASTQTRRGKKIQLIVKETHDKEEDISKQKCDPPHITYMCEKCDEKTWTGHTDHTHPDLSKFEETAMEWDEFNHESYSGIRVRMYLCVKCRIGIPIIIEFVNRKTSEMSSVQSWAFDKEWDMRGLRKRLKTCEDMKKLADEYKKKQQDALLIQREWNNFWKEKGEAFRKKFAINNEDIIRSANVNNEQYNRRLRLIEKNVRKLQSSL